jgi:hypothetical protein
MNSITIPQIDGDLSRQTPVKPGTDVKRLFARDDATSSAAAQRAPMEPTLIAPENPNQPWSDHSLARN